MTTPSSWKPRLVALDVDGTMLDPATQSISAGVRRAVSDVVEAGVHVVVSTGRSMLGTLPVLDELGISDGDALCSNGAVRVEVSSREAVSVETFDPQPVYERLSPLLPGALYAAEQVGTASLVTELFDPEELHGPQRRCSVERLLEHPVPRLIVNWAGHSPERLRASMDGVVLPGCCYTVDHYQPWVTVVPDGVSKASALEKLRVELGVAAEDTLAVGDGDNDIQMLEWAHHGVAMGQGPSVVRSAADEVAGTVSEDGLVPVLRRWFPPRD
ncbi:HAD family hydrolase [Actinopolyspora mortivallis]|uniref:Haloacid dehalogenase n=1 Tax=Actinopolyspora mortivallis TaxID=33906 RepID=A0A2T0GRF3_ACTMO|nr:HAD family hydrolase [Actinopolyspora mortivallis]PRW61692.1 haloacid dehalogenase [Actinopolyspora mortivallis]